ncbi:flagellar basal-body rod modification protein FlgD [Aliiroseovarius crassostreae]|uniref:Basal-body rod modification protein FlgD n=1 Tax=Aliiroseovarius crassostreae TaxID=154981 RepID=A0A0P7J102_9RHOB|nr:flagellar hook capping FlgD N-terminal domain-containing protein [Aliiroseovarius crassostreae]KPN64853.1 flagellar basal body rod modification protein [Aliiroseovarius crassostreae]SFU83742.1 flagellar basal-body rod modification protein FlgD [Aliiroseovarius crassostreae]
MVTTATNPTLPSSLTAPPASPSAAKTDENASAALSSDFETFLTMMTVQMENQDPLNPMDSTEFAMQLATFSGVEQQVRSNSLLEGMTARLDLMGMTDVAGWVGMEARVSAPASFDGTPVTLSPKPPSTADQTNLIVKDAEGNVVQKTDIPVSSDQIEWAGVDASGQPFENGTYSFELESWSEGKLIDATPVEVYARVVETRQEDGELKLVLESGDKVSADKVTALREASDS